MMVSIIGGMVERAVSFGKHLDVLFNLKTNIGITSFCPPHFLRSPQVRVGALCMVMPCWLKTQAIPHPPLCS